MERSTAMEGFFGKKQYAAKAASVLTTKFSTKQKNMMSVKMFFDGTEIGEWAAFGLLFFVITLLFYYLCSNYERNKSKTDFQGLDYSNASLVIHRINYADTNPMGIAVLRADMR